MAHTDEVYLVNHFHEAVENGLIQAYFQPIYRSFTGKVLCVETLSRWFGAGAEMLAPDDFIPVLERNDLIFELDMEILRQACAMYRDLQDRGTPIYAFSVNFSRHDFKNEALFAKVNETLEKYQVPHEAIKLEITESLMLEDAEAFDMVFRQFHEAHYSVWLDDFGSGYSSLNVLQNYSFDVIKFDMLFLRNLSNKGRQLLASMMFMAKTLGIHTLTEGVETKEHRELLLAMGCEAQQGFYYSKPLSRAELTDLITKQPDAAETPEDKSYWDRIGQLNFMSPNPLKEYSERKKNIAGPENFFNSFDNSIALLECGQNEFNYIYATGGYKERIHDLGISSIDGLEQVFANQRSYQYLMVRKLILDAIAQGTVQTVEYVANDVYYRLSMQLLARKKGRVMLAVCLSTFDTEQEVKTAREMLNYGSALFSTFEIAVLIFPESNRSSRIYNSSSLPVYEQEISIMGSVEKFCKAEVMPVDQQRYLRFMDFKTMNERLESGSKKFIQGFFRMRWGDGSDNWYAARVTQITTFTEKTYMLTFQAVQGDGKCLLDTIAAEHPELLGALNM